MSAYDHVIPFFAQQDPDLNRFVKKQELLRVPSEMVSEMSHNPSEIRGVRFHQDQQSDGSDTSIEELTVEENERVKTPSGLPWHVQSFLPNKTNKLDKASLERFRQIFAIKKVRKPAAS